MSSISIDEIARDPTAFISRLAAGESMLLTQKNRTIAEVKPVASSAGRSRRPSGLAAGEFTVPDDFDAPLPEGVIRAFEGG